METVCSSCSSPCDDRLCSDCQFWDHFYFQPDPSSDEDGCIFCNQLKKKSAKQELKYDEGSDDVTDNDKEDDTKPDLGSETHPCGSDGSWTFYYNLIHPQSGLNIKLGDCVELFEENEDKEGKVFRCQFLLRDKGNVPWISGYEMIRSSDIPTLLRKGKKRKRKPVEEFPVSGDRVILDASECFTKLVMVKKLVCGLPLTDFEFGKPKGLKNPADVFGCGFRFDPESGSSMHFVIPDFKTCFDPLVWEKFIEPSDLESVVFVSSQDVPMTSPSILRKQGSPRKSSENRRISFSANLVQQFEYVATDDE